MAIFTLLHLNDVRYLGLRRYDRKHLGDYYPKLLDRLGDLRMPYGKSEDELRQLVVDALTDDHNYYVIALVDADDLSQVFRLTNNVDRSWVMGIRVLPTKAKRAEAVKNSGDIRAALLRRGEDAGMVEPSLRSTSVGDVVIAPDGVYYCNTIGWLKVDIDPEVLKQYEFQEPRQEVEAWLKHIKGEK